MAEFQDDPEDFDDSRDYNKEMIAWLKDKSPDVWFHVTEALNWDNAEGVLDWIVSQPMCDRANAAKIFWGAGPGYYMENYARRDGHAAAGRKLIEKILRNWKTGFYQRGELRWDEDHRKRYDAVVARLPGQHDPFAIPSDLLGTFKGRKPVVPKHHDMYYNAELRKLLWNLGTDIGYAPDSKEQRAIDLRNARQDIWAGAKESFFWNLKMIAVMIPIGIVVVAGAFFLRWWNKGLLF
jgi:hypothetical protein